MIKLPMRNSKFLFKYISFYLGIVMLCAVTDCSTVVEKESLVDTPREHYINGMQKLGQNDLNSAEIDFLRAIKLNKRSPYGHTGMAFLELNRSNHKIALKYADKALEYEGSFIDGYAAKGRIITVRKHGEKWFEEAMKPLEKALSIDPQNQRALFFTAECYLNAQKYHEAQKYFSLLMKSEGSYTERANERGALVSKIINANILTEQGGNIALDDKIDRADLCVLLIKEFQIKNLLEYHRLALFGRIFNKNYTLRNEIVKTPPDSDDKGAKESILDIIHLHIPYIDVYPNGYFYPHTLMQRVQFAMVIQGVLAMMKNDNTLSTKYIGAESPFPDVHPSYYAFNAVMLCAGNGIMEADSESGYFRPNGTVSGIEAILMLRVVQDMIGN